MNIVHYALGFPPYRTGGLTKFVIDLAHYQSENNEVFLIWPGHYSLAASKPKYSITKISNNHSIEIINPLPVSLQFGINNFDPYKDNKDDYLMYKEIFNKIKPDVVHIHTLMGLSANLLDVCREEGIKTIFTTHDFFGICPKVNLTYKNTTCTGRCLENCKDCNKSALNISSIKLSQSRLYRFLKNTSLVKILRNNKRKQVFDNQEEKQEEYKEKNKKEYQNEYLESNDNDIKNYKDLQKYYLSLLSKMDVIHCNSTLSYSIYSDFLPDSKFIIKNITHSNIIDKRDLHAARNNEKKKFLFVAAENYQKGFYKMINLFDELYKINKNFELIIYSKDQVLSREYINQYEKYEINEVDQVYSNVDCYILLSQGPESYGFTVLEAYSHAVPAIVSSYVGAKDVIKNNYTGLIEDDDAKILDFLVKCIDSDILERYSENIKKEAWKFDLIDLMSIYDFDNKAK